MAFSRITFLDWIFWGGRILWIWWRRFWWCFCLPFFFFLFLCLSAFCTAAVNEVWLLSLWLLLTFWLLSLLLVVASTICNRLNMFYFETRCFSSITVRHDGGKFVENFSTIKKSLGAVSRTSAQFTNEVRKRTGELGSTQLSELRLGEFSIRSRRFYKIKPRLHRDCMILLILGMFHVIS